MNKVDLFGLTLDSVRLEGAVEAVGELLSKGGKHFVTTPNVDQVVLVNQDEECLSVYRKASLAFADGMPMVWASHWLGRPLKERVAGSDLIFPLCEYAAREGHSVYFFGGREGIAQQAAVRLTRLYPSLKVAGCYAPPFSSEFDPEENRKIIAEINQVKPDLLFLALGAPKQEKWIVRYLDELEIKVAGCVGAAVDFAAGVATMAPQWMQRTGWEWLWRLLKEPRRLWRRYLLRCPYFFWICLSALFGKKRGELQNETTLF
jgi:exopolysaccharide biosynthesis WecB/TagA/CpsF family protein